MVEQPASTSSEYSVGNDGAVIEWKNFLQILAEQEDNADPGSRVRIIWSTTEGDMLLDTLEGSGIYWINMDGRDMIFKAKLGLPLIGKSTEHLFPSNGRYEIRIEGAVRRI